MPYSAQLKFDGSESFFQGHFPGFPIMPGVMQLKLAHCHAEKMLGREIALKSVRRMKFMRVIRPGDNVTIVLEKKGDGEIFYAFKKGEDVCSSGSLVF
ncbi:MAG: hypothetical protein J6W80_04205 [Kiritimatiellae bacterium]|nr:hypothetical protein [Kiritimatiellia bacterium]